MTKIMEKRPLLALHCSLAHGGAWAGVAGQLLGVSVTAPDLPGHGRMPLWDGQSDLHGQTTALAAQLCDQLGAPVDVIGHSFGGTVAMRLALEHPALVRSLILVEPVLFAAARSSAAQIFADFAELHSQVLAALSAGQPQRAAEIFHGKWGTGTGFDRLSPRQRDYIVQRMAVIAGQNAVLAEDAALMLAPGRLESLSVPVLLIEGGESPAIIAAIMAVLEERLPQVRRAVVAGAAHMVPLTHPEAVAQLVQSHLEAC
jgi:lipase